MDVFRYTKPIETIQDFVDSGINWGFDEYAWVQPLVVDESVGILCETISRISQKIISARSKATRQKVLGFALRRIETTG